MSVEQPRTVVIHAHGMVAAKSSNVIVQMLSKKLDFKKVRTIQFIPGGRIRVTFSSVEYRDAVLAQKSIQIDNLHQLDITESDVPITNVYVHYLPTEAGDTGSRLALLPFGKVMGITHQRFSGFKDIGRGTCIVRMCFIISLSNVTSRDILVVSGTLASRLSALFVVVHIRRLTARIETSVRDVIRLGILLRIVLMRGILFLKLVVFIILLLGFQSSCPSSTCCPCPPCPNCSLCPFCLFHCASSPSSFCPLCSPCL